MVHIISRLERSQMRFLLAVVALVGSASAAEAQIETKPNWLQEPSYDLLHRFFPFAAKQAGVGGSAAIKCSVTVEGRLADCQVASEQPVGLGFGAAALLAASEFKMLPATRDGRAVQSSTTVKVMFDLPVGGSPTTKPPQVVEANWRVSPKPKDLARYYPKQAARLSLTGKVILDCFVNEYGSVKDCRVLQESPVGFGFGPAALFMAADDNFSMNPKTVDGKAVPGRVVIPLVFDPTASKTWLQKIFSK